MLRLPALILAFSLCPLASRAEPSEDTATEETYLAPERFLEETFPSAVPKPQALWLTASLKPQIKDILGHDYPAVRIRYWRDKTRTAWILEEIGKTQPITVGIAIDQAEIARLKVLVYRETHGWEVKYPFFTDQFDDAALKPNLKLSKKIDGISGATLSVNALERLSRLALYLDSVVQAKS